ncbi:nicotinate phosphoribosyltransferase [Chitinispirillales bacterium ANBcel5]|uniref:nicotinate phosphoribosyltransferase n=1 Tax=Cellulosispirillum alkaliphilum TaxID=3039283 RepID=UPI002A55AB8D|nr:nicotinate phosphoribosyltransferase [Chitinispirillales bacterium ANBcel5]
MIEFSGTYTDQYELTMAQAYYKKGRIKERAVFDYFFRKLPFGGGYAVFAGLQDLLSALQGLRFNQKDLAFLSEQGFPDDFLSYLADFRFTGNVYSCREGEIVFGTMPVVQIEAPLIEAQIIETLLLNILNFQTLIATKASRIKLVAGDGMLVDFGLRRAQGVGGYHASRAAFVGGFDATSNVCAGRDFHLAVSGTMAHSFVQSYDDELSAFRDFALYRPDNCVLLVDTYNTLESGVPNAIIVAREMEKRGQRLKGIRLDSGDLAYLAKESRRMLDEAGLENVKIAASNKLDEYVIRSLKQQQAPIDLFGVGTSLVIGHPDGALDGVYKMAFAGEKPRLKLSETLEKITLPFKKQVYRMHTSDGTWVGADAIFLADETESHNMHHPFAPLKSLSLEGLKKEPLLHTVMENGTIKHEHSLQESASYCKERLTRLPSEYKRFENPHTYKIGISDHLKKERDKLIESYRRGHK